MLEDRTCNKCLAMNVIHPALDKMYSDTHLINKLSETNKKGKSEVGIVCNENMPSFTTMQILLQEYQNLNCVFIVDELPVHAKGSESLFCRVDDIGDRRFSLMLCYSVHDFESLKKWAQTLGVAPDDCVHVLGDTMHKYFVKHSDTVNTWTNNKIDTGHFGARSAEHFSSKGRGRASIITAGRFAQAFARGWNSVGEIVSLHDTNYQNVQLEDKDMLLDSLEALSQYDQDVVIVATPGVDTQKFLRDKCRSLISGDAEILMINDISKLSL